MPSLLGTHRTINKICPSLLPTLYFSFILLVALPNSHFPLSAITPNPLPRRQMSGSLWIRRMLSRQLGQHFTSSSRVQTPFLKSQGENLKVLIPHYSSYLYYPLYLNHSHADAHGALPLRSRWPINILP